MSSQLKNIIENPYENFIALSRYARWIAEENRRETWGETVERYFSFMLNHLKENYSYIPDEKLVAELKNGVFERSVMPSMRSVMTAGLALERDNVTSYNCAFLPVDSPRSFDETMYILMCGTGVGFSVEYKYINKLPAVPESLEKSTTVITVEDSKQGWAKAYRELLALLWSGQIPAIDVSKIRPAGARLKTMGGRSSGPQPLINLFDFTIAKFKSATGRNLKPIECHDIMCKIGEVVVVGGVRRSAMISLSNINDIEMAQAKSGNWWEANTQRALSNNSVAYSRKPDMEQFIAEWKSLYDSKSGERGIYNVAAAQAQAAKYGRRDPDIHYGTNPSLAPGTLVWTTDGVFPIELLDGKSFKVRNINGKISDATCWLSGHNKNIFRLNLEGGHHYDATAEHKWPVITDLGIIKKTTPELIPGDRLVNLKKDFMFENGQSGSYLDGFVMGWNLGDGWATERKSGLQIGFIVAGDSDRKSDIQKIITDYLSDNGSLSSLMHKTEINVNNPNIRDIWTKFGFKHKSFGIADAMWSSDVSELYRKGYIDGIFSSDGSVESSGRIRLVSCHEKLLRDVAAVLGFYGIKTTVRKRTNSVLNGKEFESWVLGVNGFSNIKRFSELFNLSNIEKQNKINEFLDNKDYKFWFDKTDYILVVSVEDTQEESDVWDISVNDESHAFQLAHCITGNCSEIILRPYEFCNLSEVVLRENDTKKDIKRKVELATILGTWQSTLTDFKYLRKIWKDNTEEERLLGVSLTGQFGHKFMSGKEDIVLLEAFLMNLRESARAINKDEAGKIGIPESAAITCVKPSGTVSQLVGVSSGMHPWHSPYYIRTVRGAKTDPVSTFLKEVGIPVEDDVMKPNETFVFSFPIKAPEGAIVRNDLTAIDHLNIWLVYQRAWCEHKPSITVSVKEEEWMDVGAWIYKNFDEVSGISFLPHSDHSYKQAPYQEVSKEEYEALVAKMPNSIRWDDLSFYETEDGTSTNATLACSSDGNCELVDISG